MGRRGELAQAETGARELEGAGLEQACARLQQDSARFKTSCSREFSRLLLLRQKAEALVGAVLPHSELDGSDSAELPAFAREQAEQLPDLPAAAYHMDLAQRGAETGGQHRNVGHRGELDHQPFRLPQQIRSQGAYVRRTVFEAEELAPAFRTAGRVGDNQAALRNLTSGTDLLAAEFDIIQPQGAEISSGGLHEDRIPLDVHKPAGNRGERGAVGSKPAGDVADRLGAATQTGERKPDLVGRRRRRGALLESKGRGDHYSAVRPARQLPFEPAVSRLVERLEDSGKAPFLFHTGKCSIFCTFFLNLKVA